MSRLVTFALALVALTALLPPASAEGPVDERCDDSGLIACAGANAGASVSCAFVTPTAASCSWSRGYVWNAYSPVFLGGESTTSTTASLSVCTSGVGGGLGVCGIASEEDSQPCTWAPAAMCEGAEGFEGTVGPIELAMGQCLRVVATQYVQVDATTTSPLGELGAASWSQVKDGAGEVCRVDDGRD